MALKWVAFTFLFLHILQVPTLSTFEEMYDRVYEENDKIFHTTNIAVVHKISR